MKQPLILLGVASALLLLVDAAGAQRRRTDKNAWRLDPYTAGEPTAMKKAGYVSFGPFPWGDDHDTHKVHAMMPEAKLLWVETAHFRIGSSLGTISVPKSSKSRRRVVAELKQLAKRLTKVKSSTKKLDRWLRLHLYAFRLENLYADFQEMLRVTDASFPQRGDARRAAADAKYRGRGPYLGMGDKYEVLMFSKASNLTRYAVKNGRTVAADPTPIVLNFLERGSILFGTCTEIVHHSLHPDQRLHSHIRFNASQLLIRGYKSYSHSLPAWIEEGIGNAFVRRWHPEEHDFSGMKNWDKTKIYSKKWAVDCRRLTKNRFATEGKRLCSIRTSNELTFHDQVCSWSRVDFLQQLDGGDKFARFLALLKAPVPHQAGEAARFESVLAQQEYALEKAFGMTWAKFDAAWKGYVLAKYPRR